MLRRWHADLFFCHPSNSASLKDRILSCIDAIAEWMQVNRLRLNPSKTEYLWCATSRRSHCISTESFTLEDDEVKHVNRVRNLGAFFESNMNTRSHVNRLVSSCYYQMRRIRSTRRSIPTSMAVTDEVLQLPEWTIATVCLPVYQSTRLIAFRLFSTMQQG